MLTSAADARKDRDCLQGREIAAGLVSRLFARPAFGSRTQRQVDVVREVPDRGFHHFAAHVVAEPRPNSPRFAGDIGKGLATTLIAREPRVVDPQLPSGRM